MLTGFGLGQSGNTLISVNGNFYSCYYALDTAKERRLLMPFVVFVKLARVFVRA